MSSSYLIFPRTKHKGPGFVSTVLALFHIRVILITVVASLGELYLVRRCSLNYCGSSLDWKEVGQAHPSPSSITIDICLPRVRDPNSDNNATLYGFVLSVALWLIQCSGTRTASGETLVQLLSVLRQPIYAP